MDQGLFSKKQPLGRYLNEVKNNPKPNLRCLVRENQKPVEFVTHKYLDEWHRAHEAEVSQNPEELVSKDHSYASFLKRNRLSRIRDNLFRLRKVVMQTVLTM